MSNEAARVRMPAGAGRILIWGTDRNFLQKATKGTKSCRIFEQEQTEITEIPENCLFLFFQKALLFLIFDFQGPG
jgi:hypothetical protein